MFRLNNDIVDNPRLGVENVNSMIKQFVKRFVNENNEVIVDEIINLLPEKLLEEMKSFDVDVNVFISDKIADFIILLSVDEEQTPDLFTEYLLNKMIVFSIDNHLDIKSNLSNEDKEQLLKIITSHCNEIADDLRYELDSDDLDDEFNLDEMVLEFFNMYTDFRYLMGSEDGCPSSTPTENSIAFWDWDYMTIDTFGFEYSLEE